MSATVADFSKSDRSIGKHGKSYSLRKLRFDPELFRRRERGESLCALATDYGVHHSTLARFIERLE